MKVVITSLIGSVTFACIAPIAFAAAIHGTIPMPRAPRHQTSAQEAEQIKRFAPRARVTQKQAIATAARVSPGKLKEAELDNEGGYLVWSVTIGNHEVIVDAGIAKVLAIGPADD